MATLEDWQQAEEETLKEATRLLAILGNGLEQGLSIDPEPLYKLRIQPRDFPAAPLQPSFRRAVVCFAQALETVNAILVKRFRFCSPKGDGVALRVLSGLVHTLQPMSTYLLSLPGIAEEPSLACTVALAGVIVTGSGSQAHRFASQPDRVLSILSHQHAHSLGRLLLFLTSLQGQALSTVRRSAFSPKVIISCIRALLWRELQGQPGAGVDMGRIFYEIFYAEVFAKERSAIQKDPALQAAIVANLAAVLSTVETMSQSPWTSCTYTFVCEALTILDIPILHDAVAERSSSTPDFLENVEACADALLLGVQPAEMGSGFCLRNNALLGAVRIFTVCGSRAPILMISYLQTAAAAAGLLLQQGGDLYLSMETLDFLGDLLVQFLRQEGLIDEDEDETDKVLDLSEPGRPLEALHVADSLLRLAAQLPAALDQNPGHFEIANLILPRLALTLVALYNGMVSVSVEIMEEELASPDFMEAARGFVQSLAKFGMRLALPGGLPDFFEFRVDVFTIASYIAASALDAWIAMGRPGLDASDLRRWHGTVLSMLSAATALIDKHEPESFNSATLIRIINSFLCLPEMESRAFSTVSSRAVVLQVYQSLLVHGAADKMLPMTSTSIEYILGRLIAEEDLDVFLPLARLGILSRLACWAEEHCEEPAENMEFMLQALAEVMYEATLSTGFADDEAPLRVALDSIYVDDEESAPVTDPSFWARMRLEVIAPLEGLVQKDAEKDGAAAASVTQLAVETAEALATRACAHVGCTTIQAFCEASSPRGKRCGKCERVRYCSRACQVADWPAHKGACRGKLAG